MLFDGYGTNIVGEAPPATGAGSDGDGFFGDADVVVRTRITHQRVAPVTMEANGCVAVPSDDGSITVWASTQSVFGVQGEVGARARSGPVVGARAARRGSAEGSGRRAVCTPSSW